MYVIGTAGHVDHGKSTLIHALTGINPDRLREEQERQMTIDLGFAWFTLPSGVDVGIVDVPGHRDFIENMLAGVGGIDAVIFIVAADEGVMPQTREHLAILDILGIQQGVIAMTKIDLVEDEEWLLLVEDEIKNLVKNTVLEKAPVIHVSSTKKVGLDDLATALENVLKHTKSKEDIENPRLPVDRVFTLKGHGTVVTGTLIDGNLKVGQEVEILPQKIKSRIRSIQTHKKNIEVAEPGSRTAINLVGVSVDEIHRGDVLITPGLHKPTWRVDVSFKMLGDIEGEIHHNVMLKCFIGTQQRNVRIRVIGQDKVVPGQTAWLQIESNDPLVAAYKDHFVLRRPSPSQTIGGGIVLNPYPERRYRRFSQSILAKFKQLSSESPMDALILKMNKLGVADIQTIIKESGLDGEEVFSLINKMIGDQILIFSSHDKNHIQGDTLIATKEYFNDLAVKITKLVDDFHSRFPLQAGFPADQLRKKLELDSKSFQQVMQHLITDGQILMSQDRVMLASHKIGFTANQQKAIDELLVLFNQSPYSPPRPEECIRIVGREIFQYLLDSGTFILVAPEVVFKKADFDLMKDKIKDYLIKNGKISVSELRDIFQTSRKFALAFLEYLDKTGTTRRDGDFRFLVGE